MRRGNLIVEDNMRLGIKDKNELRYQVALKLSEMPSDTFIKLPLVDLEFLLFDKVYFKDNEGKKYEFKIPVWSGAFLKKLDLSEVSFDNVYWSIHSDDYFKNQIDSWNKGKSKDIDMILACALDFWEKYNGTRTYGVMYGNTNALIDLSKSFDKKARELYLKMHPADCKSFIISFSRCDFSDLFIKLDDCSFDRINFEECNLSKCRFDSNFKNVGFDARSTKLDDADLSWVTVSYGECFLDEKVNFYGNCSLKNSKIDIILTDEQIKKIAGNKFLEESFKNFLSCSCGCYINDKLIKSDEEKEQIKKDMQSKYAKVKERKFAHILDQIK